MSPEPDRGGRISILTKESHSDSRDRANSPQRILKAPAPRTPFFRALIVNLAGAAIPNPNQEWPRISKHFCMRTEKSVLRGPGHPSHQLASKLAMISSTSACTQTSPARAVGLGSRTASQPMCSQCRQSQRARAQLALARAQLARAQPI